MDIPKDTVEGLLELVKKEIKSIEKLHTDFDRINNGIFTMRRYEKELEDAMRTQRRL